MAKRKRRAADAVESAAVKPTTTTTTTAKKVKTTPSQEPSSTKTTTTTTTATTTTPTPSSPPLTIQIITGSYDRILHGVTADISSADSSSASVSFSDTFLLEPHLSAIRCLALSPPSAAAPPTAAGRHHRGGRSPPPPGATGTAAPALQRLILASGSTDEQVKLYHLSAHPPRRTLVPALPALARKAAREDRRNRQLGALVHHAATVTALRFASRAKLLSAGDDATVAVTRTRDWALLSTVRAPAPAAAGRPAGDTAPAGAAPRGVSDFAVHPSLKLMITVGKGERCMRLWNLVTGKKAGVLGFGREVLAEVGEGRHASGEGRKVAWGGTEEGEEFCVAFERGVLVFGMDSVARCKVWPEPRTKLHGMACLVVDEGRDLSVVALTTEDGRILFYSTRPDDLTKSASEGDKSTALPTAKLIATLGGKDEGITGRVKEFKALKVGEGKNAAFMVISGSSDGSIRVWRLLLSALRPQTGDISATKSGTLLGTYETQNRITCLEAFVMIPRPDGVVDEDDDIEDIAEDVGLNEEESDSIGSEDDSDDE